MIATKNIAGNYQAMTIGLSLLTLVGGTVLSRTEIRRRPF
jgi:hypothetical protein